MKSVFSILVCLSLAYAGAAYSQSTINFDDLPANGFVSPNAIPNGYEGFNWNNFFVLNSTGFPPSGFVSGTVSPPNVALTGQDPNTGSISALSAFILVSGYFASAHQNEMSLEITGLNETTTVFDETFTLNVTESSFLTFPSLPVTEVDFTVSGGVDPGPGYLAGYQQMVLDNLTVSAVPEPSAALLCGVGFGLLGLWRKWRNP